MSKYENSRNCGGEGSKKQASLFQPEYDGSHNLRIGTPSPQIHGYGLTSSTSLTSSVTQTTNTTF
jgi:hypothetical protein